MMLEIFEIFSTWSLGKVFDNISSNLAGTPLENNLKKAIQGWVDELPKSLRVSAGAVNPIKATQMQGAELNTITRLVAESIPPSKEQWLAGLMELWHETQNNTQAAFFHQSEDDAHKQLEELAKRLYAVCNQDEVIFRTGVTSKIDALYDKLDHIASHAFSSVDNASPHPAGLWNLRELPPHFLDRTDELDEIKALVLGSSDLSVDITGATREGTPTTKVGVHGMSGIGKTVLTIALTHDDEVRAAFPDGVIWLDFGQAADPVARQREVFRAFGEVAPAFDNCVDGRKELQTLTADRCCLIILDDVWHQEHAEAFTRLGERCRVLITTRDAALLRDIGAQIYSVDLLPSEQAVQLLKTSSGDALPPQFINNVARACGQVPFALAMIGALIRDGRYDWQEVLTRLEAADLKHLRRKLPDYEHDGALAAIEVSVGALTEDQREAFLQCSVFAEDVTVPEAALHTLWSKHCAGVEEATDLAFLLTDRALLTRISERPRRYKIHDLHYKYLVATTREGDCLASLHRDFANAYRQRCTNGWHTGPDDGYYFQSLAYHLQEAGDVETLRDLLLDYEWLWRKGEVTDLASVMVDYGHLRGDSDAHLVHQALRLSALTLESNWCELPSQLLGRLLCYTNRSRVQGTLKQAEASKHKHWLRPLKASLQPPGSVLIQSLRGHTRRVTAVAITRDGFKAVSASDDDTLKVWDLITGTCIQTFKGHSLTGYESGGTAIAITNDERYLIAPAGSVIKVWDLVTGNCVHTLEGHSDGVTAVIIIPGDRLISSSYDCTLKIWDLAAGTCVYTLEGHTRAIDAIAVTPEGDQVVSASYDGTLKIWDLTTYTYLNTLGDELQSEANPSENIVAITHDGAKAVSARDCNIKVWDLKTGSCIHTLEEHTNIITAVAVTRSQQIVSASWDHSLKVWDLNDGTCRHTLDGHSDRVTAVVITPDGLSALSAGGRSLKMWDLASGRCVQTIDAHLMGVTALAISPNGLEAISASNDYSLSIWNLAVYASTPIPSLEAHTGSVEAITITRDGLRAITASCDQSLKVWDVVDGSCLHTLEGHTSVVNAVAFTPDGLKAISGSNDGVVKLWDTVDGTCLDTFYGHASQVTAVVITPDGRYAISSSSDCTLKVWDLAKKTIKHTLEGHAKRVDNVTITQDGFIAVSASNDKTLKVWDLVDGACLHTLEGHTDGVSDVTIIPDSNHALSSSQDYTLRVWDFNSGTCVHTLVGHENMIMDIAVSFDGRHAFSVDLDASLKIWDLSVGDCVSTRRAEIDKLTLNSRYLAIVSGDTIYLHSVTTSKGKWIASFHGDESITNCAISCDNVIVAGCISGDVHILQIVIPTNASSRQ